LILGLLELGHPAIWPDDAISAALQPIATWWNCAPCLAGAIVLRSWGSPSFFSSKTLSFGLRLSADAPSSLALSGLMLGIRHVRPLGPLACLSFLIGATLVEFQRRDDNSAAGA
jgi:hypothetical protein